MIIHHCPSCGLEYNARDQSAPFRPADEILCGDCWTDELAHAERKLVLALLTLGLKPVPAEEIVAHPDYRAPEGMLPFALESLASCGDVKVTGPRSRRLFRLALKFFVEGCHFRRGAAS